MIERNGSRRLTSLENVVFEPFRLERDRVSASEIYGISDLKRRIMRRHQRANFNSTHISLPPVVDFPENLSAQDLQAKNLEKQAQALLGTDLLSAIGKFSTTPIRKYLFKIIMREIIKATGSLNEDNITLRHGSRAERELAWKCFSSDWPPGVDLYDALEKAYPAYHAQMVGHRPQALVDAAQINRLIGEGIAEGKITKPSLLKATVKNSTFMGLFPVIELPKKDLGPETEWKSQDQLGRKELCDRILQQADGLLTEDPNKQILVVDYAGGVGNLTEVLFQQIDELPNSKKKTLIQKKLKVIVRELHQGQINGGLDKFTKLEKTYPWIKGKYAFVQSDITKPIDEEQTEIIKKQFGGDYEIKNSILLGMTAYTLGALPPPVLIDLAKEIKNDCYYFDAIDFSSPAWRQNAFLKQTGNFGRTYLRNVHGVSEESDSLFAKIWLKAMRLARGLGDHYNETWPGEWGHNSGYGVQDDGTLRKPSILEFGELLHGQGLNLQIRSTVNSFSFIHVGKTSQGNVALGIIPGWVRDDIFFINEENKVPKKS